MLRRFLCLALVLTLAAPAAAAVKTGALFTDGMVLQRDMEAPVWGTAAADETVSVTLGDAKASAQADASGKWVVKLPPQKAGGPYKMVVAGAADKIEIGDVYVGEVWIASGQSNMHWTFSHNIKDKEKHLSESTDPLVRQFTVTKGQAKAPAADVGGRWYGASRENLLAEGPNGASAVGYFFGRELRKELNVPVGIINSSVGGTPIEQWSPGGGLFNNMIHPMAPLAVRGAIWYQGESNCIGGAGMKYVDLTKKQVAAWRKLFGEDLSYYLVQIAPYSYTGRKDSKLPTYVLPEFWQAQGQAAREIPNAGMVVINDLVENVRDIHPSDKLSVGKRLAAVALAKNYGRKDLVTSGPTFAAAEPQGATIRVKFENVGTGLVSRDGKPLTHFLVAGEDKKFQPAEATIDGDGVVLKSSEVTKPVAVRFAWDETAMPNLANKDGWPAGSFRSDDWKLGE
jgi:sialate O-acetylesterase